MGKQEQIKTILGISLLYTIITSIFSFLNKLNTAIFSQDDLDVKIRFFLQDYLLWMVIVAAIIIVLIMYAKRLNQGVSFDVLSDSLVRITASTLVILDGIIHLSGIIPLYVMSVQSTIQASHMMQQNLQRMLTQVIVSDVISVLLILCQVFVGIYLIRFYKIKTA
jgi:hypothetical protein